MTTKNDHTDNIEKCKSIFITWKAGVLAVVGLIGTIATISFLYASRTMADEGNINAALNLGRQDSTQIYQMQFKTDKMIDLQKQILAKIK
jgi:hypothetical protein